ncbi:MAG: Asp23/Gls24 family envelope stress response protein [Chloroflexi bacterium]|nr:Asp23/Gls24 family envelope stress response protein [Chloroflexota bacterium]
MSEEHTPYGRIHISTRAIAAIAHHAVLKSYGVVGLAPKNLMQGIAQVLTRDPTQGVEVQVAEDGITIDLYLVVQYGTNIRAVADSAANTVRYHVEKALGLPVKAVNVHIRGLRINDDTGEEE